MAPLSAHGGAWRTDLKLAASGEYIDNPRFLVDGDESARKLRVSPECEVSWGDGIDRLYGRAGVLYERTSNQDSISDRTDPRAATGWSHRMEHGSVRLDANYDVSILRVSESNEGGLAGKDGERLTRAVSAAIEHAFGASTTASLRGGYSKAHYDISEFNDFELNTVEAAINRTISARTSMTFAAAAERRRPMGSNMEQTDLYSSRIGAEWKGSERLTYTAQAGGYRHVPTDRTGWIAHSALDYRLETGNLGAVYERNVTTDAALGLTKSDTFGVSFDTSIDERTSASLGVKRRETWTTTHEGLNEIAISGVRRLSETLGVGAYCRWISHDSSGSGDARGYTVGVSFTSAVSFQ